MNIIRYLNYNINESHYALLLFARSSEVQAQSVRAMDGSILNVKLVRFNTATCFKYLVT